MGTIDKLLYPLEYAVAWLMVGFHAALSTIGLPETSGWTWALSIIGLVIVIRIILIPLFVKQIKASRGMQLIQPQMQAIQKKYKGRTDPESRQAMTSETMALYKDSGTNPFASCLPILLQAPIFFALFRVLNQHVRTGSPIGPLTTALANQADKSTLLGAPLSATFMSSGGSVAVKVITVLLIILMSATTFTTQRQLMMKNMPAAALDNPFAKQQKMLLYVLPVVFAVSGVNFPIGVLLYWLTTNAWSMGQQFYVIRRMPAPGSPAELALQERRRRKGLPVGDTLVETETDLPTGPAGQRQQPKRAPRQKRAQPPVSMTKGAADLDPGDEAAATEPSNGTGSPNDTPASAAAPPSDTTANGAVKGGATADVRGGANGAVKGGAKGGANGAVKGGAKGAVNGAVKGAGHPTQAPTQARKQARKRQQRTTRPASEPGRPAS